MSVALLWEVMRLTSRHDSGCAIAVPPDEDRFLVLVDKESVKVVSMPGLLDPIPEEAGVAHWLVGQLEIKSIDDKWRESGMRVRRVIPRRDTRSLRWLAEELITPSEVSDGVDGIQPTRALDCVAWTPSTELLCSSRSFVQACVSKQYMASYWYVAATSTDGELVLFPVFAEHFSKLVSVKYSPQYNVTEYLLSNSFPELPGVVLTGGDVYKTLALSAYNASRRFAESLIGPWYPMAESQISEAYDAEWFTGRLRCWTVCFIADSPTCTLVAGIGNRVFLLEIDDAKNMTLQWWCEFRVVSPESHNYVTSIDALWHADKHLICCGLSGGFVAFIVIHPDQRHEFQVHSLNPCPIMTCKILEVVQGAEITCAVHQEMVCTTLRFYTMHPKSYYSPIVLPKPEGGTREEAVAAIASLAFGYANGTGLVQDSLGDLYVCPLNDCRHVYQRRLLKVEKIIRDTVGGYVLKGDQAQTQLEADELALTGGGSVTVRGQRSGCGFVMLSSGLLLVAEKSGSLFSVYAGWLEKYQLPPARMFLETIFARGCVTHPLSWKLYFNGPSRQPDVRGPSLFGLEAPPEAVMDVDDTKGMSDEELVAEAATALGVPLNVRTAKVLLQTRGAHALALLRAMVKNRGLHTRLEERLCQLVSVNTTTGAPGDADDERLSDDEAFSLDGEHHFEGVNMPDLAEERMRWSVMKRWGAKDEMEADAFCHICEQFFARGTTSQCPLCRGTLC